MQNNAHVVSATIEENTQINSNYYILRIRNKALASGGKAGRFLEFACGNGTTLRRPLAYMDVSGESVRVLYKVVGPGTEGLKKKLPGESISVVGPLGNSFTPPTSKKTTAVLVGGGVGIPPLYYLAKTLFNDGFRVNVILGASTQKNLLLSSEFAPVATNVIAATDDGSYGLRGTVLDALSQSLVESAEIKIYACGPKAMLRALTTYANTRTIDAELSLEAYMGCGFGVCLGCVVQTTEGYKLCCKDGPVFDAKNLLFD